MDMLLWCCCCSCLFFYFLQNILLFYFIFMAKHLWFCCSCLIFFILLWYAFIMLLFMSLCKELHVCLNKGKHKLLSSSNSKTDVFLISLEFIINFSCCWKALVSLCRLLCVFWTQDDHSSYSNKCRSGNPLYTSKRP